jgi:hypothetical protein
MAAQRPRNSLGTLVANSDYPAVRLAREVPHDVRAPVAVTDHTKFEHFGFLHRSTVKTKKQSDYPNGADDRWMFI